MGIFQMPSLGADMEDGTLVEWMVKPGDAVHRGDIVAVVETQKGAIEIEIFEDGVVQSLDAELNAKLPVGAPLATILAEGEAPPSAPAAPSMPEPTVEEVPEVAVEAAPELAKEVAKVAVEMPKADVAVAERPAPAAAAGLVAASPAARKWAAEHGIDLSALTGTGPSRAIVLSDVQAAVPDAAAPEAAKPEPSAARAPVKPVDAMAEMRKAIAAAMQRSKREIPHYQLGQTIDIQTMSDWLAARNADMPPTERILLGAVFLKAAAVAASRVKEMNGHYGADGFEPAPQVNLGVAVALRGGGLIAPAIPQADTLALPEFMAAMKDLVARARANRLRSSELTSGTITISALGEKGAEMMTGIIFPPQVALLAIGAPQTRAWVMGDTMGHRDPIAPRRVVTLTLSADHRVSDGRHANKFLAELETLLQSPEAL